MENSTFLMTPDIAMQFMVWSYYYHDVLPEKNVSYSKCGKFSEEDVKRRTQGHAFQVLRGRVCKQCLQAIPTGKGKTGAMPFPTSHSRHNVRKREIIPSFRQIVCRYGGLKAHQANSLGHRPRYIKFGNFAL